MLDSWRYHLKRAEAAFVQQRLDEAAQLIAAHGLGEYRPGQQLQGKLGEAFLARAEQRMNVSDYQEAWRNIKAAKSLGAGSPRLGPAVAGFLKAVIGEVTQLLAQEDVCGALARLDQWKSDGLENSELVGLRTIAKQLDCAAKFARRGQFADAASQLRSAYGIRKDLPVLAGRIDEFEQMHAEHTPIAASLHAAARDQHWERALILADAVLEMAPEHPFALKVRRDAWRQLGANLPQAERPRLSAAPASDHFPLNPPVRRERQALSGRFLLWVDAVGGYLCCLNEEIQLGQAAAGNPLDVPILGDLSKRHAVIRRQAGDYIIEPVRGLVRVENRELKGPALLSSGDEIQLGASIRLRFTKPHPLSATARLDFSSRHRTQPMVDGVLLMAESSVLGPSWQNHIIARDWTNDVVLYRQGGELYCRCMDALEIDGRLCDGRGKIQGGSHVVGEEFSMSVEAI